MQRRTRYAIWNIVRCTFILVEVPKVYAESLPSVYARIPHKILICLLGPHMRNLSAPTPEYDEVEGSSDVRGVG